MTSKFVAWPARRSAYSSPLSATLEPICEMQSDFSAGYMASRGYRIQLAIGEQGHRAFTRNGYDWTDRYGIVVAAAKA